MGNDGGSIPRRVDMVKARTPEVKKDYVEMNKNRSKFCAISNAVLKNPIVGCKMGYMYNKEIQYKLLINKQMPSTFKHIKRTKHVRQIKGVENPNKDSEYPFICPQSQTVFNGLSKFIYIWNCGCMMSYKLLLNASDKEFDCPVCNKTYKEEEIILLTCSPEQLEEKKRIMFAKPMVKPEHIKDNIKDTLEDDIDKAVKKLKVDDEQEKEKDRLEDDGNILDALATKGSTNQIWKGLFHKEYEMENNNDLTFRNVRFGIR